MVAVPSGSRNSSEITGDAIRAARFSTAKSFGRGYEHHEVDRLIARCADAVDALDADLRAARAQLSAAQAELIALRVQTHREGTNTAVDQAVSVLNTAQRTAEAILRQANEELEKARDSASLQLEQARHTAAALRRDSERAAQQVTNDAARRAGTQEQEAIARLERLTTRADLAQRQIEREAEYLQTFREASRTQLEEFIDGVLDHVAEQYGRAHPLAAQAAATAHRRSAVAGQNAARQLPAVRGRRGLRIAGRPIAVPDPPIAIREAAVERPPRSGMPVSLPQQPTGDEQIRNQ